MFLQIGIGVNINKALKIVIVATKKTLKNNMRQRLKKNMKSCMIKRQRNKRKKMLTDKNKDKKRRRLYILKEMNVV